MDPNLAKSIADAGGWAAFVALVMAIGMGVVRKWWVPGWLFDREIKASEALRETNAALTKALNDEIRRNARPLRRRPDASP